MVADQTYFWQATGNDGWIDLCVTGEIKGCQKLFCEFDYHYLPDESADIKTLVSQFVITPYIVRQVIEHALSVGWKPFAKGKDLGLKVDDKIDLRAGKNITINEKKGWLQFSLHTIRS